MSPAELNRRLAALERLRRPDAPDLVVSVRRPDAPGGPRVLRLVVPCGPDFTQGGADA